MGGVLLHIASCNDACHVTGLIQNEQDDIVSLVKELVEESIRSENTIILVTIPAGGTRPLSAHVVLDTNLGNLQTTWKINKQ